MKQLPFFYMKRDLTWKTPKEPFYAIKYKNVLYPCHYLEKKNETFIRGTGWVKSKKNQLVPLFSGQSIEDLNTYIETYSQECLYYSITGYHITDDDCCNWAASQEFRSCVGVGFEYAFKFLDRVNALNDAIGKILFEKYGLNLFYEGYQIIEFINKETNEKNQRCFESNEIFHVRPSYSVMAYFLTKPTLDVIYDDEKLEKFYWKVCNCDEKLYAEFPVSVKDRLSFLFNDEISKEYESIMNEFPMC